VSLCPPLDHRRTGPRCTRTGSEGVFRGKLVNLRAAIHRAVELRNISCIRIDSAIIFEIVVSNIINKFTLSILFLIITLPLSVYTADASDQNRFTVKPGGVFCKSLTAMHALQNSLLRRDGKAASLLNSQDCSVSPTTVVVYVVHEEEDMARVQLINSGKYFWISKQSLR
jgi:hypothetical protein